MRLHYIVRNLLPVSVTSTRKSSHEDCGDDWMVAELAVMVTWPLGGVNLMALEMR